MLTFTSGTTPEEVIIERLPHKYPMELNKRDMCNLLEYLDRCSILEPTGNPQIDDWPSDFRSSILSTIGIEEI